MVIAKKILQTIDSHTISQNRIYKSKTSKYDGKVVECEAFPAPIGTTSVSYTHLRAHET